MDGDGVEIIGKLGAAAAMPKPYVIEGPGYRKLAHATDRSTGSLAWEFLDLPFETPGPEPIYLHTLSGLAEYVSANRDNRALNESSIIVKHHAQVLYVSRQYGELPRRDVYAIAQFEELIKTPPPGMVNAVPVFAFGQWLDPDAFNVALQTLFVDSKERARVLEIVGNVRTEGVTTIDDDGVAQGVVASAGVRLGKVVGVPNPVALQPFRTFREVDQPESKFVLRAKGEKGEMPRLALFEADGGAWKLAAIDTIAEFMISHVPEEVVVIA